jgi:hypothetical protein
MIALSGGWESRSLFSGSQCRTDWNANVDETKTKFQGAGFYVQDLVSVNVLVSLPAWRKNHRTGDISGT